MGREELIINERKRKLNELIKKGINPYPHKYSPKNYSSEIKEKYKKLKENQKTKDKVKIAGRVMTIRDLGKLIFSTLQDSKGKIQIIFQKEGNNEKSGKEKNKDFELFKKYVDSGDFVGVEGIVMKTKTGEVSVLVKKFDISPT